MSEHLQIASQIEYFLLMQEYEDVLAKRELWVSI